MECYEAYKRLLLICSRDLIKLTKAIHCRDQGQKVLLSWQLSHQMATRCIHVMIDTKIIDRLNSQNHPLSASALPNSSAVNMVNLSDLLKSAGMNHLFKTST